MLEDIKIWVLDHSLHACAENNFLYLDILLGVIILFLLIITILKLAKDIKKINKESRKRIIDFFKKTSKYNKKDRKRLKF